tara:strand:- start:328 stop:516 length:189 start_codon:yes stop_codon:yes gene_type:complete
MNVISTTINYKGTPIKIENGKVFARAFGTTINNHSMHWTWQEIKQEAMKRDFKNHLKENNLI